MQIFRKARAWTSGCGAIGRKMQAALLAFVQIARTLSSQRLVNAAFEPRNELGMNGLEQGQVGWHGGS